jgi:Domain of unknown function (DUF309)
MGHMFGQTEVAPRNWDPGGWRHNELYLYGVDLFNSGYWWEAHAAWEALWKTTRRGETAGRFLQGLIQIAAALVQHRAGRMGGARKLASKALAKLHRLPGELGPAAGNEAIRFMGVDLRGFASATERYFVYETSASARESGPPGRSETLERSREVTPPLLVLA